MRIFYAANNTPNSHFPIQSNLWRENLYLPLIDLGHEIVEFDYDLNETFQKAEKSRNKSFISKNRPRVTRELLSQIRRAHREQPIDLFFSYFFDGCVMPEAIDEISDMGIKTANWFCNASYQFHMVEEIAPHYDWCLVPEKFRLKDYVDIGANPIYCQEAANPYVYKPFDLPVDFDVTFVGQAYGERPRYIRALLDEGIDVRVWGHGWGRFSENHRKQRKNAIRRLAGAASEFMAVTDWHDTCRRLLNLELFGSARRTVAESAKVVLPDRVIGGVLSDQELIQLYSRSKINLGFSACDNPLGAGPRIMQIRLRDFEVPMSGGFYLVEYMEELEEFFEIGKEIVCYESSQDLMEKIKYFLKHDAERERVRKAGHERCSRDHTWHKRFETVFRKMGLTR